MKMSQSNIRFFGCNGKISSVNDFISKVSAFSQKYQIGIQTLDAEVVFGKDHIISAFHHAKRSFDRNEASMNSLEMELLLYAAGERQIKHALKKMGVKKGDSSFVTIFIINDISIDDVDNIIDIFIHDFNLKRDDEVLNPDKNKLTTFGIDQKAINSVKKDQCFQLVLEKVALVDIIK